MTPIGSEKTRHDGLTIGAIAAMAALIVITGHEAVGHGSVCFAVGGQVTLLSSSLFRCSAPSAVIDVGGPVMNLSLALIALVASRRVPLRRPGLRLGLMLVAAFGGFWEGGYLVQAMITRQGDLHAVGAAFIGEPLAGWRIAGGVAGACLYMATLIATVRGMQVFASARWVCRVAWLSATTAAVATASLYRGGWGDNLLNTFLEIGLASVPLLFIPDHPRGGEATVARQPAVWIAAALVLIVFAATLGLGIGDPGLA